MENNPAEVVPEKVPHSSGIGLPTEEQTIPSTETKSCGEKISVLATKQYTDISKKPAQDESAVKNLADSCPEASDEEVTLSLHLSESDNFEDLMDEPIESSIGKSNKTIETEKYFSDIESSDDSQGYITKSVLEEKVVGVGNQVSSIEKNVELGETSKKQASPKRIEKEKILELDLEPVESDEEDFDEISSLEEGSKAPEPKDLPIVEEKPVGDEKDDSENKNDELSITTDAIEVNLLTTVLSQGVLTTDNDEKLPSPETNKVSEEDEILLLENTVETFHEAQSTNSSQAECITNEQHDPIVEESNREEMDNEKDREDCPSSPGQSSSDKRNDSQNQLLEPKTTELLTETDPEEKHTLLAITEKDDLVGKQLIEEKNSVDIIETSKDNVTSEEHVAMLPIETALVGKKGEASESKKETSTTDKLVEVDEFLEKEESTAKVSTCTEQPAAVDSLECTTNKPTEDERTNTDSPKQTTKKIITTSEEGTNSATEAVKSLDQVNTLKDRKTTELDSSLETPKECEELTPNLEKALVEDTVKLVHDSDSEKVTVKVVENSDSLKDDKMVTDKASKELPKNLPLSKVSDSKVATKSSEEPEKTKTVVEKKVIGDSVEDNDKEAVPLKKKKCPINEEKMFGANKEKRLDQETKSDKNKQLESENKIESTKSCTESIPATDVQPEIITEADESKVTESSSSTEEKDTEVTATKGLEEENQLKKDDKIIDIADDMPPTDSKVTEKESEKDTPIEVSVVEKDSEIIDKQPSIRAPVAENGIEASPTDGPDMKKNTDKKLQTEPHVTDDTTMKNADDGPSQGDAEDEETLLVVDTSHKEEPYSEDIDMDTENEQTATSAQSTDSSSEGSLEIFYEKECVNYECKHTSKHFFRATMFTLNYFKISKKRTKPQFVCDDCYDRSLESYEKMCRTLKQKQPLLHETTFKVQEFVEIIDSSDEEENEATGDKIKDENTYSKESIQMLEAELEGAILKVMNNVELQNQLSWTKQILQQRLNNLEEDTNFVGEQLRLLQKQADHMHNSLYQCPKIKIRQLTPLDLNSGRTYNPEGEVTIPPVGEVLRCPIRVDETYYAVKNKAIASWVPCKVVEEIEGYSQLKNLKHFKIKFSKSKYPMLKTVSAKHMAFFNPPSVRLPIGTRVIAYFDASSLSRGKEKMLIPSAFYPGIIAEPLKQSNKFRYLVFYDDGYFQYVYHKDVRLVCQASENVWDDVHHQSREFIHNYLTQYSVNRPMVQTQKGQSMLVDYNNKWIYARVIDVDCSLVQMLFEGQNRSEWIYRGSTRLGPVYKESNNLVAKNSWNASRIARRTEPFIRYINGDDSSSSQSQQPQETQQQPKPGEVRSVAKKSVSRVDSSTTSAVAAQPVPTVRHLNNSTIFVDDDNKPKGKVVYYTARKNLPPRDYVPHICSPTCPFLVTHNLSSYSPLAKPLLSGWERQVFRQKNKKFIVYRGPCGKRMRCMEELHRYLRVTENDLNVDNFDFGADTNCLAEYVIESCIVQKKDISNGKEKMPIPCVNYYDNTMPPDCVYSSKRIPTEGVPLNLDREFLVGCDCEDDCSDKSKCSCWELTYAGAKYGMPNVPNDMVGYQYKRLYEHVPTGIYECNSRCKCKANCVNRVVQQPLQSKLQVFKTSNRGWGLRCINDVPRGSFICVYAGHLLTEQKANEGGLDAGDEYFAELDYIEVAEQIKEGYESDVPELDEDEELYNPEKEDDDDEFIAPSVSNRAFSTRLRARRTTKNSSDAEHDSQERQVISFEPNKTIGSPMDNSSSEKPTIRKLFGKDEACYVMDAKITGNLGRYFNHSCSPNLFVQNVFVDTHDLRFPWVAFFAFTHIRAGTELTWNYNYEVGVVPGKVLYCQCGAPNCRQRLL